MKGLPTGYDRDMQEGKPLIWMALKEARSSLNIMAKTISSIKFKKDKIIEAIEQSYAPAIELTEALIKHAGLSLREAHKLVGYIVKALHEQGRALRTLTPEELSTAASRVLGKNITLPPTILEKAVDAMEIPGRRTTVGSASPKEIRKMIERRREMLAQAWVGFKSAEKNLLQARQFLKNL